jgi:hypothetical protein
MKKFNSKFAIFLNILIIIILCSCEEINPPSTERKLVEINLVHEDNVNGRLALSDTNIIDNFRFVYNTDGSLNSVSVFDDSSSFAILQKEVKFVYYPNKVRWFTFKADLSDTSQYKTYDAYFNDKNQIIRIADTANVGFNFYYENDKLTAIEDTATNSTFLKIRNFVYNGNNLVKYDVFLPDETPIAYAEMEYNSLPSVELFDISLYSQTVVFLFIADLNILSKTGLNYGIGNTNLLRQKSEYLLSSPEPIGNYIFNYEYDEIFTTDIVKRSIVRTINSQTDSLFYQYKY